MAEENAVNQGQPTAPGGPARHDDPGQRTIQDVSAWVLRIGVVASSLVMVTGLAISFLRHSPSVGEMKQVVFKDGLATLGTDLLAGRGLAVTELGILMLVLTPIVRVAASMVIFLVVERDWFYALVTLVVLVLTLLSLLIL